MSNAKIASAFDQLILAIRQLPREQKIKLWQVLDAELVSRDIDKDFDQALQAIWAANQGITEDEVMADAIQAIREFRVEQAARRT